jgi:hypothetical protein
VGELKILKDARTHADVFAIVGLADLLSKTGIDATLWGGSSEFHIAFEAGSGLDWISSIEKNAGYLYLHLNRSDTITPQIPSDRVLDYQLENERHKRYRDALKQARADSQNFIEEIVKEKPIEGWQLYKAAQQLKAHHALNRLVSLIEKMTQSEWESLLRQGIGALFSNGPSPRFTKINLVQLFTPQSAKGYARLKPDSTDRNDKTKDSWAEPFIEFLRFRGYFQSACPCWLGKKREHVRILTPDPLKIGYGEYIRVVRELRKAFIIGSAPQIDCLAALNLCRILVKHSPALEPTDISHSDFSLPSQQIRGFYITHYQSMGQAHAVTSIDQIALPDWQLPLHSARDAEKWLQLLDEHIHVLKSLKDSFSDEIAMVLQYRRALEPNSKFSINHMLQFYEAYGGWLVRKRAQNNWKYRQFTDQSLEAIVSGDANYLSILNNVGFQAIAKAIRSSTVSAQIQKKNNKDHRDIRYDLLPELRRKRQLPGTDPFLMAVGDFIATYNLESARRQEQRKGSGNHRVSVEEFEQFVALFENPERGNMVSSLLCAHATCRQLSRFESTQVNDDMNDELEEETESV